MHVLYLGFTARTCIRIPMAKIGRSMMPDSGSRLHIMMMRKRGSRKCVGEIFEVKSRMGFHSAGSRCIVLLVGTRGGAAPVEGAVPPRGTARGSTQQGGKCGRRPAAPASRGVPEPLALG
jgi:hypothetical protein